jgi:hypothetical protein
MKLHYTKKEKEEREDMLRKVTEKRSSDYQSGKMPNKERESYRTSHLVPGGTGRVHPLQKKLMAKKMKKGSGRHYVADSSSDVYGE